MAIMCIGDGFGPEGCSEAFVFKRTVSLLQTSGSEVFEKPEDV